MACTCKHAMQSQGEAPSRLLGSSVHSILCSWSAAHRACASDSWSRGSGSSSSAAHAPPLYPGLYAASSGVSRSLHSALIRRRSPRTLRANVRVGTHAAGVRDVAREGAPAGGDDDDPSDGP